VSLRHPTATSAGVGGVAKSPATGRRTASYFMYFAMFFSCSASVFAKTVVPSGFARK
jgi:hypothetical protein